MWFKTCRARAIFAQSPSAYFSIFDDKRGQNYNNKHTINGMHFKFFRRINNFFAIKNSPLKLFMAWRSLRDLFTKIKTGQLFYCRPCCGNWNRRSRNWTNWSTRPKIYEAIPPDSSSMEKVSTYWRFFTLFFIHIWFDFARLWHFFVPFENDRGLISKGLITSFFF